MSAADRFVQPMDKLDSHISTELMKAVANLTTRNETVGSSGGNRGALLGTVINIGKPRPLWRNRQKCTKEWR